MRMTSSEGLKKVELRGGRADAHRGRQDRAQTEKEGAVQRKERENASVTK